MADKHKLKKDLRRLCNKKTPSPDEESNRNNNIIDRAKPPRRDTRKNEQKFISKLYKD